MSSVRGRGRSISMISAILPGRGVIALASSATAMLAARVRALVRRADRPLQTSLSVGTLSIDPASRTAGVADRPLDLGATEFRLLELLARNRGITLSRAQILEKIWDYDFQGSSNIVDVYVSQLRRKLKASGTNAQITTVWGIGYKLVAEKPKHAPSGG